MSDPSEESAVLNLDSGVTLDAIATALRSFARTIPDMAVTKVTFTQEPDVGEDGVWKAGVSLHVFGDLRYKGFSPETATLQDTLAHAEPDLLSQHEWTAQGPQFAGAVEALCEVVEKHLQGLILQREQDLAAANEALVALRNPGAMDAMWAVKDNPRDDPSEEENP